MRRSPQTASRRPPYLLPLLRCQGVQIDVGAEQAPSVPVVAGEGAAVRVLLPSKRQGDPTGAPG